VRVGDGEDRHGEHHRELPVDNVPSTISCTSTNTIRRLATSRPAASATHLIDFGGDPFSTGRFVIIQEWSAIQ
jgi:hypothetical protein